MKVSGVMFDWDGVLLDSMGASFNVYDKIFVKVGTKRLTKREFLELQSPNWYEFYARVGLPKALWKEVDEDWVKLYEEEHPSLHEDALPCLSSLSDEGIRLALVTNGSKARVEGELDRLQVRSFFDSVAFGEKAEELKPAPVMLRRSLDALRLQREEAVYVGDAPADIQAARNAGVSAIAIARGPIEVGRLVAEGPDWIFSNLAGMTRFLINR